MAVSDNSYSSIDNSYFESSLPHLPDHEDETAGLDVTEFIELIFSFLDEGKVSLPKEMAGPDPGWTRLASHYKSAFESCPKMKVGLDSGTMSGPHVETNWLIPGRVLCGSHPNAARFSLFVDPQSTKNEKVAKIMSARVSLFVDLTDGRGSAHREAAVKWAAENKSMEPRFVQHKIREFSPGSGSVITAAVRSIIMELERSSDAVVYLHCRAGHGRTGMVAAVLLGAVYPTIEVEEVMLLVQEFHNSRVDSWNNWQSPETEMQSMCARELIVAAREMGPEAFTSEVVLPSFGLP